jgi:putative membrane protein
MLRLLVAWAINAGALWIADVIFSGVRIHGWAAFLIGAAVLGIANAILKPVLTLLTLPLVIVTLGLFMLVINIAMVALAEWIAPNFAIDGFWTYIGTVVVIWLVNWVGHTVADELEGGRRRRLASIV